MYIDIARRHTCSLHSQIITKIMSTRVETCLGFLDLLISTYNHTPTTTRTLLSGATNDQLLCLTEVIVNTLEGNLRISARPQHELARFKKVLRRVPKILDIESRSSVITQDSDLLGQHQQHTKRNRSNKTNNSGNSRRRTSPLTRKLLRELYVKHYKTITEFLKYCIPHLKRLFED